MGARLVGAALNPEWATRLTPTERLILHAMAHTAHDSGGKTYSAGEYWGGHEYLILTLNGDVPAPDTKAYESARKIIQRSIARLVHVGAIQRIEAGSRGHRARYKITLDLNQPTLEEGA